jgi:hypothetical protein
MGEIIWERERMQIIEINLNNRKHVKEFLELPFQIYKDVPQWVPPLDMDAKRMLDRKRNPFFIQGEAGFWLAYDAMRVTGRLAVLDHVNWNQYNQEHSAFFYLFECIDDQATAQALFDAGFNWARGRGLDRMIGPKGFTVLDGIGMLVKGFEHRPAFGLPYNLPYYPRLVEDVGFTKMDELVSGYLDETIQFPEKIKQIAEILKKRRGLTVTRFQNRKDLREIIDYLKDLYNAALSGTQGNVPLTDEEIKSLADQMLWFADPKLIKIIKKGDQPVGFLLAYPDISAAVQRTRGKVFPFGWIDLLLELRRTKWININGAGMADGYRGLGGTALLFSEMFKSVSESRYRYADLVQIGIENEKMQRELRDLGIDFYKLHRLYETQLTDNS